MLLSVTGVISTNVDKVMLGYFWTFKEVGYYFSVHLIGFALVGVAVYVGVLFIIREFKKRGLKFSLDLVRPVGMLEYIKSELKKRRENEKQGQDYFILCSSL